VILTVSNSLRVGSRVECADWQGRIRNRRYRDGLARRRAVPRWRAWRQAMPPGHARPRRAAPPDRTNCTRAPQNRRYRTDSWSRSGFRGGTARCWSHGRAQVSATGTRGMTAVLPIGQAGAACAERHEAAKLRKRRNVSRETSAQRPEPGRSAIAQREERRNEAGGEGRGRGEEEGEPRAAATRDQESATAARARAS